MAKTQKNSGSIIARDMVITGEVTFRGRLEIQGAIYGELHGEQAELCRGGILEGGINLQELDCRGVMRGQVVSTRLLVRDSADISGTIQARELDLAAGAAIQGEVMVSGSFEPDSVRGTVPRRALGPPQRTDDGAGTVTPSRTGAPAAAVTAEEEALLTSLCSTITGGGHLVMLVSDADDRRGALGRNLRERLAREYRMIVVDDPVGSVRDVMIRIAAGLDVSLQDYGDQNRILEELTEALRHSGSTGSPFLLFIDNGEKMYPATLDGIIRNFLGAAESGAVGLMPLVLSGGTELKQMLELGAPELRHEPDCIIEL